jgi:hypothetical protein
MDGWMQIRGDTATTATRAVPDLRSNIVPRPVRHRVVLECRTASADRLADIGKETEAA